MTEEHPPSELGRERLTLGKRVELLERDRAQHSRALTELVEKVGNGFTDQQLAQIRSAFREELADAGLRIDGPDHQDEAREDFRFLRRIRKSWDTTAARIGGTILTGILLVMGVIVSTGFWAWISSGGR